ncbi:MAG TPA: hypothetical protein PLQ82_04310, partial [Desulfobacteraceae bacterium]|nr:hypothetical protein [Desulfobacteraceae bacterium]
LGGTEFTEIKISPGVYPDENRALKVYPPIFVVGLPANLCGGFTRQSLWRVYPPVFVEGLPASLCGGFTRQSLWRVYPPIFVEGLPASLCGGVIPCLKRYRSD